MRRVGGPPCRGMLGALGLAGLLYACSSIPTATGGAAHTAAATEQRSVWRELTRLLPQGADRCTAARPGTLDKDRRAQFALVSRLPQQLWSPAMGVEAAVRVDRHRRGGRGGHVIVLRSGLSGDALRRAADTELGIELRWSELPIECGPDSCPYRARLEGEHIVVITGGQWLAPSDAVGVEAGCAALAAIEPTGLEWSVVRGESLLLAGGPMMPLRTMLVVRAGARALTFTQRDRMVTPELAAQVASAGFGGVSIGGGYEVGRTQEGDEVVTLSEVLWDDLRMRIEDEGRLRAARSDAERILSLRPGADVDVDHTDRVHAQVAYRLSLMEASGPAERASIRAELIELLRRALNRHPEEVQFARTLVDMLLTEPAAATEAAAVAGAFVDDASQGVEFRLLRKHALALSDLAALADVLVKEGVARRSAADGAAGDIAGLLRAGHSYGVAERTWALSAGIARRARRVPIRAVGDVELPLASLVDGLLALRHLGAATGELHVLVQHEGGLGGLVGTPSAYVMGGRALLRVDPTAAAGARSLGERLVRARLSGPLELTMPARERGERVLRLRGEARGETFVLQAADARSAKVDWPRLAERMFLPLSTLAEGEFSLPASSRAKAARMVRLASGAFGVACTAAGTSVRCRARGALADRGRAALLALVAKELSKDAQRLWSQ